MNKKTVVPISVTIIYVALVILFIYLKNRSYGCSRETPCIHFCSSDTKEQSNLLENFKKTKFGKTFTRHTSQQDDLIAVWGAPVCGKMKYVAPTEEVNSPFYPHMVDLDGEVYVNGSYTIFRNCFDKSEDDWKLMICYQDYYFQKGFHILTTFISICLLGFTLFVHAYFQELRDFHGKIIVALTGSQIITFILFPLMRNSPDFGRFSHIRYDFDYIPLVANLVITFLWITVLVVHTFLTFKNFKNQTSIPYEFSTYAKFVISFSIVSAIPFISLFHVAFTILFFTYILIAFIDIVLLIITGVKIFIISRHLEHSEKVKFDTEKKWYWIIIKLTLMTIVTVYSESDLWSRRFDMLTESTVDLINLFTSITIFLMFVGRKKAKNLIFTEYRKVRGIEIDAV